MSLFLEIKRESNMCRRKKHDVCKNRQQSCGCSCHRIKELQEQLASTEYTGHLPAD